MKNIIATTILALAILTVAPAHGQAHFLRGLDSFKVWVASSGPEGPISEASIKTQAELEFRKVGIKIDDSTPATFEIAVTIVEIDSVDALVYDLNVSLVQRAHLSRDTSNVGWVRTWIRGFSGFASNILAREAMKGAISDVLDQFLNDYLKANPVNP